MCIVRHSRFVGISLITLAIVSMIANALLLFPNLQTQYLLENHITPEATWGTGLWASGFLMLIVARSFMSGTLKTGCCGFRIEMVFQFGQSLFGVASAGLCFIVSATGLVTGPLCLYNSTQGLTWGQSSQLQKNFYWQDPAQWDSACEDPPRVVLWHIVLFSILMSTSGIQVLLCAGQVLNALLNIVCGPRFGKNKVGPVGSQSNFGFQDGDCI